MTMKKMKMSNVSIVLKKDTELLAFEDLILSVDHKSKTGRVAFDLIKFCKTNNYLEENCHLMWEHLVEKYTPRSAPSLLVLGKQFENSCLISTTENPEDWIMELEDICNKILKLV